jgi:uncharacterized protein YndB with AHSA1/START domain
MPEAPSTDDAVVIERSVAAPASSVWRMWTDPALFAEWYGPDGAVVTVVEMDVRVGGARTVDMEVSTPSGPRRMRFTGEHREVVDSQRLVYTESVVDDQGGTSPATEVVVVLTAVGDGTRLVLTHRGVPAGSPGAAGWEMALDKLVARGDRPA